MTCYSPLKGFVNKEDGGIVFRRSKNAGEDMEVACGQCMGCRIDKSQEWAARIVHEAQMHQANCFVTLTYNKEHVPWDGSLVKEHFQKFMKRLRKHNEDKKIRYYHCGEYGEENQRPHYHACIFGMDFDDRVAHSATNEIITYTSETLEKIWGKGFCTVGELNYETAAYTSRYVMKKITGIKAETHYEKLDTTTGQIINLQPEYVTMSLGKNCKDHKKQRDPNCDKCSGGIGWKFYEKYKSDFYPRSECPIPGRGVYNKVPKYYEGLYGQEAPDALETIKKKRKKYLLANVNEYSTERLHTKYKVKKAALQHLKRTL